MSNTERARVLFNPYTGERRHINDVQSDPQGLLIVAPGSELQAARRAPVVGDIADFLTGMSVSVDVSTGDHDAGNRLFGTVTEVMEESGDKNGLTLLIQDAKQNFVSAPVVPQGWKLVPVVPTNEMIVAAADGDKEYSLRNFGPGLLIAQSGYDHWCAMLAAAPQPPDGLMSENRTSKPEAKGSVSNVTLAAPVQLPEPVAVMHHNHVQYSRMAWDGEMANGTRLYTEQQVRQLLADRS